MNLFLLIVGVLCLSGYCIAYSVSPPERTGATGTAAQDEAAFLTTERDRFDELVAHLGLHAPGHHPARYDTTRRHSVDTITSDALDALYAERDRLRERLDEAHRQAVDPTDPTGHLVAALVEQAVEQAAELRARLADSEAKRAGVYRERARLLGWLASLHPDDAFLTAATDVDEPDWKVLHLGLAGHRLRWHIAPRDLQLFDDVTTVPLTDPRVRRDDGTTDDKYQHIRSLTRGHRRAAARTMTTRPNIDALLDGYAHRGTVIKQALHLVDTVLDTPTSSAAEQRPVHDFAHRVRRALLVSAPKTGD